MVALSQSRIDHRVSEGENLRLISDEGERLLSIIARANEITCAADTSCVVHDMLDLIIEVTQADSADFFQLDAATDELILSQVSSADDNQLLIGLRINRALGMPGISLCNKKVIVIGDLPSDPDWLRMVDPERAARKKNVINLPVAHKDLMLGVIQIFNFQQASVDLLQILGDQLAAELDRRNKIDSFQRSNQRLLTLVDMLKEVAGTLDRNHLLHLVTENAARLVDAERSSVFLIDPNTKEMIFQVAYQQPEQNPSSPDNIKIRQANLSKSPANALNSPGRQMHPTNFQEGEFSYFNRSAITVPLRSESLPHDHSEEHNHVLGGLMVLNNSSSSFQEEDAQLMRILANQVGTFLQVADMYENAGELFLGVIKSLITAIDAKDPYTQGHSQRVSDYSVQIAREIGLNENSVNDVRIGSLFHDIGKIGIPDSILLKNSPLTNEEFQIIKKHPKTGINILSQVKPLGPMLPAILEHHERLDGSGYPAELIGKQISWMGRIVAVADVFDAMTSNRPYRKALSVQEVLAYLNENSGILFDATCVQALKAILARSKKAKIDESNLATFS
jgi:HD-GYP domain-containing protein (c-di-GMP phosphodiesterase class II)